MSGKLFFIAGFFLLLSGLLFNAGIERWGLPFSLELMLPPIAVWLCVTAALFLIWTVIRQTVWPTMRFPVFPALLISACLALLYGAFFVVAEVTDKGGPEVMGDCEGLCQTVAATVSVPRSAFEPSKPAVFCQTAMFGMFLTRYDVIQVYGVTKRSEQDRVLQSLSEYRQRMRTKPIRVQFYEKENVTPFFDKEGKALIGSGQRGPERLIRVATIR